MNILKWDGSISTERHERKGYTCMQTADFIKDWRRPSKRDGPRGGQMNLEQVKQTKKTRKIKKNFMPSLTTDCNFVVFNLKIL